jgi:transketolase
MRQRFYETANQLLDANERIAVALADIGTTGFDTNRHPDRVVNVGIREQALIGVTAGLALSGLRPIAHSYTPFLIERPFEQIKLDLGHQDLGAILVSIGASHDAAAAGRTHQAPGDVALMSTLPGWTIQIPGHPDEVEAMLVAAVRHNDRVYIRLAEDLNVVPRPVTHNLARIRTGSDRGATVVAVGPMLDRVLAATEGMDVTVLYATTVNPFDRKGLRSSATDKIVIVEPYLEGTSVPAVSGALSDRPTRILSIGVPNLEHRHYGTRHDHTAAHGMDEAGIRARISDFADVRAA